jgi:hypothetical protein
MAEFLISQNSVLPPSSPPQQRTNRRLTKDDAREIIFFNVLAEWFAELNCAISQNSQFTK